MTLALAIVNALEQSRLQNLQGPVKNEHTEPLVQTLLRIPYGGSTALSGACGPSKCRALSDKSEPTRTMGASQVGPVTGLGPLRYDLWGRALGSKALFWVGCYQESGVML